MSKLSRYESIFKCVCCKTAIKKISEHNFIYDEDGNPKDIHQILVDCIGKEPQVSNNLNQAVCTPCSVQLQQSYMFKQMCLKTDNKIEDGLSDEENIQHVGELEHVTLVDAGEDSKYEEYITDVDNLQIASEVEDIATLVNAVEDNEVEEDFQIADDEKKQIQDGDPASLSDEIIEFVESDAEYLEESVLGLSDSRRLANTQLGDCLTIDSYKQKFRQLAPTHLSCDIKREAALSKIGAGSIEPDCTSLDVEKIATSDDLIKILEDDYHSENDTTRKRLDKDMDADEFKIPKIEVWDVCEDVEYLEEEKPIDIDEYLLSISTTLLNEYDSFSNAAMCNICKQYKIESFSGLVRHVVIEHNKMGKLNCCLCSNPPLSFKDVSDFKNHLFIVHGDLVQPIIILTCQTCDGVFSSVVKFGKHSCKQKDVTLDAVDENYTCSTCDKQLISKNRYVFHQQFHLSSPRPKVCLVCQISFDDEHKFYEHVNFSHELFPQHFCMYCDKSFTTEWEWKRHEHCHTAVRNHDCESCGKSFLNKQTLHEHEVSHHLPEAHFRCDICSKTFARKSRLRKHMAMHQVYNPQIMPMCSVCHQIFENDIKGIKHLANVHGASSDQIALEYHSLERVLCCEFCELPFYDGPALAAHKETHTGDLKFECSHCTAKYDTYSKLRTHCNTHKGVTADNYPLQRLYMCDEEACLKPFRDWKTLQSHRKTVHLINPTIFKCHECDETFYQSWTFSYHKKKNHIEHLRCPFCDVTFVLLKSLQNHVNRFHVNEKQPQSERRSASAVKSETPQSFDFEKFVVQKEDGLWYCRECDRKCSTRHNAATHVQMVHWKVKNFHCTVCNKGYFLRGDFDNHMRIHTSEVPFECSYCDYKTRKKSMLQDHIRSHTNERPYECEICQKSFKRRYVLNMHLKRHTGNRAFSCPQCGKEYITQAALNSHVKRTHVKIEKLILERKRKAIATPIKEKSMPKLIFIMPGPVPKTNASISE